MGRTENKMQTSKWNTYYSDI